MRYDLLSSKALKFWSACHQLLQSPENIYLWSAPSWGHTAQGTIGVCQPVVWNVSSVTADTVTAADVGAAGAGNTKNETVVGTSWKPGSGIAQ